MKSILQDWVMQLGLRQQGVLISAVRGCDGIQKDDPAKALVRALRCDILNAHCGDPAKAASFIEKVDGAELKRRMDTVTSSFDHYPVHFIQHLMAAAQVIGYYHMGRNGYAWRCFYKMMCHKLHVTPESMDVCARRLDADEPTFAIGVDPGSPEGSIPGFCAAGFLHRGGREAAECQADKQQTKLADEAAARQFRGVIRD